MSQKNGTTTETINYTAAAGTYYARVYGYRTASHATSCYTLRVATGTASREEEYIVHPKMKVNVYPNPVKGTVNIQIEDNKDKAEIRLFDMYGRLVMQQLSSNENTKLNVSKLSPGVYLVKIIRDEVEISTARFIKE